MFTEPANSAGEDDGSSDLLGGILEQIAPPQEGPEVSDKLASIINARFVSAPVSGEAARTAVEAVKRPANCVGLRTPSINKEVFDTLSAAQKRADWRLAACHKATMAAATETTRAVDALVEIRNKLPGGKELEQPIKAVIGALGMLGHTGRSISQIRREALRASINPEYQQICAPDAEITPELLFGEGLAVRQRDLAAAGRLSRAITRTPASRGAFQGMRARRGATNTGRGGTAAPFLASTPGNRGGFARGRGRGRRL